MTDRNTNRTGHSPVSYHSSFEISRILTMAITVSRPKLNWRERLYLPAILSGMAITIKHFKNMLFGRTKVTMQYPEEKRDSQLPDHYRGAPALVRDDTVACVVSPASSANSFARRARSRLFRAKFRRRPFREGRKISGRIRYRHDPLHLLRHVRGSLPGAGDFPAKRLRHHRLHPGEWSTTKRSSSRSAASCTASS